MDWHQVTTGAQLERWHRVHVAAYDHDYTALPADPLGEYKPLLGDQSGNSNMRKEMWLGTAGDRAVVAARLELPVHDNVDEAQVDVFVAPDARRRGFGTRALGLLTDRCRELGRIRQTAQAQGPLDGGPSAARAYAASLGFAEKNSEVRRLLDVEAAADLDALEAAARPHADGYRLVSWVDRAPDDLVEGLAVLAGRMSTDAPSGDLSHEPETWDVARWRRSEQNAIDRGRLRIGTTAVTGDGTVVAYTDFAVSPSQEVGYQWDTIVAPDHRGHRLGMLVKVANLRRLRELSPGTRWVNTWNAASNTYMIAINEAIGWRPVDAWASLERTV